MTTAMTAILFFAILMGLIVIVCLIGSGIGVLFSLPSYWRQSKQFEAEIAAQPDTYVHVPDGRRRWFTKGVVIFNRDGRMIVPDTVMDGLLRMARSSQSQLSLKLYEALEVNIWHLREERRKGYRFLSAVCQPLGRV